MFQPTTEERIQMLKGMIKTTAHGRTRCQEKWGEAQRAKNTEEAAEWKQKMLLADARLKGLRIAHRIMTEC